MKKKRDLKRIKNRMLRETIGSFLSPLLVPLLLLSYDFPIEVNIIFIVVTTIVGPIVGFLFLRAYLIANTRYKESLRQVSSSYLTKSISSSSIKKEEKPKITSDNLSLRFPPISDKKEEHLKVTSYTCKSCGNELIKKGSFCPYCCK